MAIDSRNKRASVVKFAQPWIWVGRLPSGTVDAAARADFDRCYSGISLLPPTNAYDRSRRASVLQFQQPWIWVPPLPSGSIAAAGREHLAHLYTGLPSVAPSQINTRNRRAAVLQFQQPWVFIGPLPDASIGSSDREQLTKLYSGIPLQAGFTSFINTQARRAAALKFQQPWIWVSSFPNNIINSQGREEFVHLYSGIPLTVPTYTGTSHLSVGLASSDLDAQNIAYATSTYNPLSSVVAATGSGSFLQASDVTGQGSFLVGAYVLGTGTYVGDNFAGLSTAPVAITLSSAGTFVPFTGTSFGNSLLSTGVNLFSVGHYLPPPSSDVFAHFMECNQLTFEETICAIYKNMGQQGGGGISPVSAGGRGLYFEPQTIDKLLDEIKKAYALAESKGKSVVERVIERQPIYITQPGQMQGPGLVGTKAVGLPDDVTQEEEDAIVAAIAELLEED